MAERLVHGRAAQSGEMAVSFELQQARRLMDRAERPLSDFVGTTVHAVAGIGDPQRFFEALRAKGLTLRPHPFPDHHRFMASDLSPLADAPVLMTEKDAVKCTRFATSDLWEVPLQAQLPADFLERVDLQLRTPVGYVTP